MIDVTADYPSICENGALSVKMATVAPRSKTAAGGA